MARIGFVGGAYQADNLSADQQSSINFLVEKNESGAAKGELSLIDRPGLATFCTLGRFSVSAGIEINGRVFFCSDGVFYEVFADGSKINRGAIVFSATYPASLAASQTQVMIASGGKGYCFTLATNALSASISTIDGVIQVGFLDDYFVAAIQNTQRLYLSALLDGNSWNALDTTLISVFPDVITGFKVSGRRLLVQGNKNSVLYYDSGNTFPFDVVPGGDFEMGLAGTFGSARADGTVFFWSSDERGGRMFWRLHGSDPLRISTHAIEKAVAQYGIISDVVCWPAIFYGHTFVVSWFPSANKTWVYDVATGLWAEWAYFANGVYSAFLGACHVYVPTFEKHLVGDRQSGKVYEMKPATLVNNAWTFTDDAGQPMRRERISPYVTLESVRVTVSAFELEADAGLGQNPSGGIPPGGPQVTLPDANGVLWNVTIDDTGIIHHVVTTVDVAQTILINDSTTAGTTWQLGLDPVAHVLTATAVAYQSTAPFSFLFATTPGDLETAIFVNGGILQQNNPIPVPRPPAAELTWSDDRGHSWSEPRQLSLGAIGEYGTRMIERRLGQFWGTSGRLWKLVYSDQVPLRITDAHMTATPDYGPTPRLAAQLRKGA
jgi:hypothetical protein